MASVPEVAIVQTLGPLALVALRIFVILQMQALWRTAIGWAYLPVSAGASLVLALGVGLDGAASGGEGVSLWSAVVSELAAGVIVGGLASLPGYAVLGAGATVSRLIRAQTAGMVALTAMIAAGLALALGVHRPLLLALTGLFEALPLGRPDLGVAALEVVGPTLWHRVLPAVTVLALALATPVLLTAAVAELSLGLLEAGPSPSPSMGGALRAWTRTGVALVALGASWSAYAEQWAAAIVPSL